MLLRVDILSRPLPAVFLGTSEKHSSGIPRTLRRCSTCRRLRAGFWSGCASFFCCVQAMSIPIRGQAADGSLLDLPFPSPGGKRSKQSPGLIALCLLQSLNRGVVSMRCSRVCSEPFTRSRPRRRGRRPCEGPCSRTRADRRAPATRNQSLVISH